MNDYQEVGWRNRVKSSLHVLAAAGLCAVSAEMLAGYSAKTGHFEASLFDFVFFMALYGAPALLVRDFARRRGWGWPPLLLSFTALAIAQACIIDQSLFAEKYGGYCGWEESRAGTLIPMLGLSAYNAHGFIIGHVIFSFGAPIAIVEAWRPRFAGGPWLRKFGIGVACCAYLIAATLITLDPQSRSASPVQLAVSIVVMVACVIAAVALAQAHRGHKPMARPGRKLRPGAVVLLAFSASVVGSVTSPDWFGFAAELTITCTTAALTGWASSRYQWGVRHAAAVGLGYLLSRSILAFTYFPLAGSVGALPKYVHNSVMLVIVLVSSFLALRRGRDGDDA